MDFRDNVKADEFWFIREKGHIPNLAESARLGSCDDIDVDRIYWLGRTCLKLLTTNETISEILTKQTEDIARIGDDFTEFHKEFKSRLHAIEASKSKDHANKLSAEVLLEEYREAFKHLSKSFDLLNSDIQKMKSQEIKEKKSVMDTIFSVLNRLFKY